MHRSPRRRPTLNDVAAEAGTSIKTVSRVVNREGTVSSELTARVEEAIDALGYERDDAARRLRSRSPRTDTLGLIVFNLGNPFYASIAEGAESVASERGTLLITASSYARPARQDSIVRMMASRRVDGLLVVPVGSDLGALEREAELGTPIVFVDDMPDKPIGDVVLSDHRTAALSAVEHLLSSGHERVAFLGTMASVHVMSERHAAYEEALGKAGIPLDQGLVGMGLITIDAASEAVERMLELPNPPTAVFSAYIAGTIGALRVLRQRNLQDRVALVSSDDLVVGDLLSPGLTSTPQDPHEIGRRAAERLFQRLDGDESPTRTVVLPVALAPRGTGEIRPRSG